MKMKNKYIDTLEDVLKYLRLHNRVMYDRVNDMLEEIKEDKVKRNKYKLDKINEKRKIDKTYGGHNRKKVSDK
jgi:hypothetical protein